MVLHDLTVGQLHVQVTAQSLLEVETVAVAVCTLLRKNVYLVLY